jgi:hypothetical protein
MALWTPSVSEVFCAAQHDAMPSTYSSDAPYWSRLTKQLRDYAYFSGITINYR